MTISLIIESAAERGFLVREGDRIVAAFSTARELGDYVAKRFSALQPAVGPDDADDIPRIARPQPSHPSPGVPSGIVHRMFGGST